MKPSQQEAKSSHSMLVDFHRNKLQLAVFLILVTLLSLAIIPGVKLFIDEPLPVEDTQTNIITFDSDSFPTIQLGHYTLWADTGEEQVFLKRFNSIRGQLVSLNGNDLNTWEVEVPDNTIELFVTIEKEGDRDETPHAFELMRAELTDNTANMQLNGIDFESLSGSFLLATPTDGNWAINERSGAWFINTDLETTALQLEDLGGTHWLWEARLKSDDGSIILGEFSTPTTSDTINKYSETAAAGFQVPGEDLLQNLPDGFLPPLNLGNGSYTVVISLEPNLDGYDFTGQDVFVPVLEASIPEGTKEYTDISLKPVVSVPTLSLTIE